MIRVISVSLLECGNTSYSMLLLQYSKSFRRMPESPQHSGKFILARSETLFFILNKHCGLTIGCIRPLQYIKYLILVGSWLLVPQGITVWLAFPAFLENVSRYMKFVSDSMFIIRCAWFATVGGFDHVLRTILDIGKSLVLAHFLIGFPSKLGTWL